MATGTATRTRAKGRSRSAEKMREALDRALEHADADEVTGPLLRATRLRLRVECPDIGLVLNLASSEGPDRCIEWRFDDDAPWETKLRLRMASEVADRWLRGDLSIPIAIARGEVTCSGNARFALLYLPAAKLIGEHYEEAIGQS
jgi:hypothetical protein